MFTQLKELLPKAMHKKNLSRSLGAAHVCEICRQVQEDVLGDIVSKKVHPKYVRNRVLTLCVPNSVYAQEVHLKRQSLLQAINSRLSRDRIMEIRTTVSAPFSEESS